MGRGDRQLGTAHFIARRILRPAGRDPAQRVFSRPIVVIAVLGIVVGMAVMILTVGIATGFQREVRAKVTGAGGHIRIESIGQTDPKETPRLEIGQPFYPWLDTVPGIAHIQAIATKPGIIETGEEIQGVVVKGVGSDHDWRFIHAHLVAGALPAIGDSTRPIDLLLSRHLSRLLAIAVDDTITVYLVRGHDDIRPRRFRVCGLYATGLEQLDHQMVYVDIDHLQRFAQWGLKAELQVHDTIGPEGIRVEAWAYGGDRIYRYAWPGTALEGKGPHWIQATGDTTISVVVSDADGTIPDTAWVRFEAGIRTRSGPFLGRDEVAVARGGSGGSHGRYAGAFEVLLDDFREVDAFDERIYAEYLGVGLRSVSVKQRFPEIFAWLELLDTNVVVVIVLMIIVAIINMTSALLILILERTAMIGTLKALGASNGAISRIFLIDAGYILGAGIGLGIVLGVLLALVQQWYGIISLPLESYYVEAVPVELSWWRIALLGLGTMLVCLLALIIPSSLVARIAPARAIRFQ